MTRILAPRRLNIVQRPLNSRQADRPRGRPGPGPCHIADPTAYKLHFARHNGIEELVGVLLRSCEKLRSGEPWTDWHDWQAYRPYRNEFNRDYVFTLARYERPDRWLFGGILWRV